MTDIEILTEKIDDLTQAIWRTIESHNPPEERLAEMKAHLDAYENVLFEIAKINSKNKPEIVSLDDGF